MVCRCRLSRWDGWYSYVPAYGIRLPSALGKASTSASTPAFTSTPASTSASSATVIDTPRVLEDLVQYSWRAIVLVLILVVILVRSSVFGYGKLVIEYKHVTANLATEFHGPIPGFTPVSGLYHILLYQPTRELPLIKTIVISPAQLNTTRSSDFMDKAFMG
jgi:hypothetical protein